MHTEKLKFSLMLVLTVVFLSYSLYLYAFLPVHPAKTSEETMAGKEIWQQHNCNACHQVYGLGGYLGPDLTNVYSSRGEAYIKAFLSSGTTTMPDFHLTAPEINALLAYLRNTDASGKSDPRTYTINTDGTIEH